VGVIMLFVLYYTLFERRRRAYNKYHKLIVKLM
jgi:hypothetical protein